MNLTQKTKESEVVIACIRGASSSTKKITTRELEAIQEKTPTCSIPCANGSHEDCGGSGCECDCHQQHEKSKEI